jgi:F-type H+-transporting ATPase subunit gamma
MENASKNAGEMINKYVFPSYPCFRLSDFNNFNRFQILYNRQRQATITGELVEIITGATASADM